MLIGNDLQPEAVKNIERRSETVSRRSQRMRYGSHFIQKDGNILTLQKILGHSSLAMTMRYAHLAPEHLAEAVRLSPLAGMNMIAAFPARVLAAPGWGNSLIFPTHGVLPGELQRLKHVRVTKIYV